MSMTPHPEEYEQLRKLLACKRHEVPPPGYFDGFSSKVISRLECEEPSHHSGWWAWMVNKFDARPVIVCAYGAVVSSLLLAGFRLSQIFEREMAASTSQDGPWLAATPNLGAFSSTAISSNFGEDSFGQMPAVASKAFGPEPARFLLQRPSPLRFQPVAFSNY